MSTRHNPQPYLNLNANSRKRTANSARGQQAAASETCQPGSCDFRFGLPSVPHRSSSEVVWIWRYPIAIPFSSVQNLVISSKERPLVSGMSHATRTIVNKAPALKSQKVPSDPRCFCMMGKDWFPKNPTSQRAVVAIDIPRPRTFVG